MKGCHTCTATLTEGLDPYGSLDEDEFLEVFHKPPVDDPVEKEKRAAALKQHEKEVLENNEAFLAGNQTWWDQIDEFSDLPDDEFLAGHTGLIKRPLTPDPRVSMRPSDTAEKPCPPPTTPSLSAMSAPSRTREVIYPGFMQRGHLYLRHIEPAKGK